MLRKILIILSLVLLTSCSNVRWRHPVPSQQLMLAAMTEMKGLTLDSDSDKLTEAQAIDYLTHPEKITANTPGFTLVAFELENKKYVINVMGVSHSYRSLDILDDDDFARYDIPNSQHLIGYTFSYRGYIDGFLFVTPHMVHSADERDSLMMKTTPLTSYRVNMLYDDGTSYGFDFSSTNVGRSWNGRMIKTLNNGFNGKFFVGNAPFGERYHIYSPF